MIRKIVAVVGVLSISTTSVIAQNISSSTTVNPGTHNVSGTHFLSSGATCTLVDFEGVGNNVAIGTIAGTPNVTFGATWLGLIDADAGGDGNFANEPSPDTAAYFLEPAEPINFDAGVQFIEVFYSARGDSVPVTLTAWDGPNGTGNIVDTAIGATVGESGSGANCVGDPAGSYCLWDVMQLTAASNNILSVTLSGAVVNAFGFDNMTFCTDVPALGACCTGEDGCVDTTAANCASLQGKYIGDGIFCDTQPCGTAAVPAVSEWGLIVLVLIGLVAGTLTFGRKPETNPAT